MQDAFSRMELLVGNTGVKKTQQGENCSIRLLAEPDHRLAESLARCGVGSLTLIDHEKITLTEYRKPGAGTSFYSGNEQGRGGQEENPGY